MNVSNSNCMHDQLFAGMCKIPMSTHIEWKINYLGVIKYELIRNVTRARPHKQPSENEQLSN